MARRVLAQDLEMRLPAGSITLPGEDRIEKSAIVVDMQEFDVDAKGQVVLDVDWSLFAGSPRRLALHRHERIALDGAQTVETQPQLMSRTLGVLADRIVNALQSYG